jgi:hypothetical protein
MRIERLLELSTSMMFYTAFMPRHSYRPPCIKTSYYLDYGVTVDGDGTTPQSLFISTNIIFGQLMVGESFSANAGPGPYAYVAGTVGPGAIQYNGGSANAVAQYDLQLNGPAGTRGNMIPISVAGSLDVQATVLNSGDAGYGSVFEYANAYVTAYIPGVNSVLYVEAFTSTSTSPPYVYNTGPFTGGFNMIVGTPYVVQCVAQLTLYGTSPDTVTGSATADPTFTLASNYLAAGYSLAYSRGLTVPPQLAIIPSGTNVIVTWPTNETGFTLQSSTNLISPVWSSVSGQFAVTNPISGSQQFFRLFSP